MTFATQLTKVRYRSEHFDERTEMCYHQAPPSERVVVHVRDAGQAKPHLEHNPLSLLGACSATLRRKLNDPGQALIDLHHDEQVLCRLAMALFISQRDDRGEPKGNRDQARAQQSSHDTILLGILIPHAGGPYPRRGD